MGWLEDFGNTLNNLNPGYHIGKALAGGGQPAVSPGTPNKYAGYGWGDQTPAPKAAFVKPAPVDPVAQSFFGAQAPNPLDALKNGAMPSQTAAVQGMTDLGKAISNRQNYIQGLQYKRAQNYWTPGNAVQTAENSAAGANIANPLGRTLQDLGESFALHNVRPESGIAAQAEADARIAGATALGGQLNNIEQERSRNYIAHENQQDAQQQAFDEMKAKSLQANDMDGFNALERMNEGQFNMGSTLFNQGMQAQRMPLEMRQLQQNVDAGDLNLQQTRQRMPLELQQLQQAVNSGQISLEQAQAALPVYLKQMGLQGKMTDASSSAFDDQQNFYNQNKPLFDMLRNLQMQRGASDAFTEHLVGDNPLMSLLRTPSGQTAVNVGMKVAPMFAGLPPGMAGFQMAGYGSPVG